MFESPQRLREEITSRVQSLLYYFKPASLDGTALIGQFVASAIDIRPWSEHQLTAVRSGPVLTLGVAGDHHEVPSVVYYKPIAAAGAVLAVAAGVLGAASALFVGLAVVSGILAINGVRTVASAAESLLFWVVYSADGHRDSRETVKARFEAAAATVPDVEVADFEPALHALARLGCVRIAGTAIEVADRIIVHWH